MSIITPMMRQYQAIKEQYSDCLLFFRLGDFYELFNDDAIVASRELNLVLTSRAGGIAKSGEKVPMCGVPYHAVDNYVARLIEKGFKIAICEQQEDPKLAKGLVKRDVIRVVTPGTVIEENMLPESRHNYLAAVWPEYNRSGDECRFALAYADISTGEFCATELHGSALRERLSDELARIGAAELVLPQRLYDDEFFKLRIKGNTVGVLSLCFDEDYVDTAAEDLLKIQFRVSSLEGLGLNDRPLTVRACAAVLYFLQRTQKRSLDYIDRISVYGSGEFMFLDAATRRNLELTETIRSHDRRGSLLWVLDATRTSMGARLLREWLESPLLSSGAINKRLNAVRELSESGLLLNDIRSTLHELHDIQRLITRVNYGSAGPRELAALRSSVDKLPAVFALMGHLRSPLARVLFDNFDLLSDISELLNTMLSEDPPLSAKDGGVIRDGCSEDVDRLRGLAFSSQDKLHQLEVDEREKTGIKTLKVGYNRVFGYYIEISKGRADEAPERYIRKQTLTTGERFITEELKTLENDILTARERLLSLEYTMFSELRDQVNAASDRIRRTAEVLAHLDVLQSLAYVAAENNYCCPQVDEDSCIDIVKGRHPVVEQIIGRENYVANDCRLDHDGQRMMLITGPNMTGKSTYMRQTALIVLMARIGSFVPAESAHIGACDRIFTRVGAADDLASGQSTFMVEMNETSNILRNATERSLVILDEIGRGTSTFDGLSIAWAVAEYLIKDSCAARTLFATHYHELTALSESFPLIRNYSIAVKEKGSTIIFLRRIVPGGADKSYGIQVAQLAGLPAAVIDRAKDILTQLESEKHIQVQLSAAASAVEPTVQPSAPEPQSVAPQLLNELKELDINNLSPMQALLLLADWKNKYHD